MTRPPVELHARKGFTPKQRADVFTRAGGRCGVCGGKIAAAFAWEVEHRVPLALGGTNEPDNLEPVHADLAPFGCHAKKTRADVKAIAKAKRLAGETGAERQKRAIPSRGFPKDGPKQKIPSRPFPKRGKP